jgi:predicted HAD superfamily hydrolase
MVLDPRDVFQLMQIQLGTSSWAVPSWLCVCFKSARIWAEFRARRRNVAEDVNLADIYQVFIDEYLLPKPLVSALQRLELDVEKQVLIPVAGADEFLHQYRNFSDGLVFISDMYLPADFIRTILSRYQLFHEGDRLYVSGENGLTKGTGKLFQKVLEDLTLDPDQLIHMGDHFLSDLQVPRSLGIKAVDAGQDACCRVTWFGSFLLRFNYALVLAGARIRLRWYAGV